MADLMMWFVRIKRALSIFVAASIGNLEFVIGRSSKRVNDFQFILQLASSGEDKIAEADSVRRVGLWSNDSLLRFSVSVDKWGGLIKGIINTFGQLPEFVGKKMSVSMYWSDRPIECVGIKCCRQCLSNGYSTPYLVSRVYIPRQSQPPVKLLKSSVGLGLL